MDVGTIALFLGCMALTAAGAYALTQAMCRWAPAWGFVDRPDGRRKLHREPTPLLGGVAIFGALLGGVAVAVLTGVWASPGTRWSCDWLLTAGLFCLLGMVDDRHPLRPRTKFCWQIVASLPFACSEHAIRALDLGSWQLELGWWGIPCTVFWIVACVNAFNLIDGLDGLASGTVLLTCLAWAVLGLGGDGEELAPALLLAAALAGFLCHNRPPARIFLGDTGSLMLGFATGSLGLEVGRGLSGSFSPWLPLIVLSIPLFDTTMAILRRKLNGRGIGQADREHIHHCFVDRGWSRPRVLIAILCVSALQGMIAILGQLSGQTGWAICAAAGVLLALMAGRLFGHRELAGIVSLARQRLARLTGSPRFNPLEWLAF